MYIMLDHTVIIATYIMLDHTVTLAMYIMLDHTVTIATYIMLSKSLICCRLNFNTHTSHTELLIDWDEPE